MYIDSSILGHCDTLAIIRNLPYIEKASFAESYTYPARKQEGIAQACYQPICTIHSPAMHFCGGMHLIQHLDWLSGSLMVMMLADDGDSRTINITKLLRTKRVREVRTDDDVIVIVLAVTSDS